MYYTIYKITNLVTGQYYIGRHITENLDDDYYGSGRLLKEEISNFGKESFQKEILYVYDNFEDMNCKERELVTFAQVSSGECLNLQQGGSGFQTQGTVVVFDLSESRYIRIPREKFDPTAHQMVTKNTVVVKHPNNGGFYRIPVEDYDPTRHITPSTGKLSVRCKESKKTKKIELGEFDPTIHEKVFGGIVAIDKNTGIKSYVSKKEFDNSDDLVSPTKGKVTAYDKVSKKKVHVSRKEYYSNRDRYNGTTTGLVTVLDLENGEWKTVSKEEFRKNRQQYKTTTEGQKTVYLKKEKRFANIDKREFDRSIHALAGDKRITCVDQTGNTIIDFFGSKTEFVELYGLTVYNVAIRDTKNWKPAHKHKFAKFYNCSFTNINWRKQND